MADETGRDRTGELEARLAELERRSPPPTEGRSGIETAFWAMMSQLFPDEARKHLRAAGREQLLAARVYLDRWIAQLDASDAEAEAAGSSRTHERIEIE